MADNIEYIQTSMMDATEKLEAARTRFKHRNSQYQSPVERKVDMDKYPSLPEGATDKDTRLMLGALQRHVLDLEMKLLGFEAKVQDLETMFTNFMTELMKFIDELSNSSLEETEQ